MVWSARGTATRGPSALAPVRVGVPATVVAGIWLGFAAIREPMRVGAAIWTRATLRAAGSRVNQPRVKVSAADVISGLSGAGVAAVSYTHLTLPTIYSV